MIRQVRLTFLKAAIDKETNVLVRNNIQNTTVKKANRKTPYLR